MGNKRRDNQAEILLRGRLNAQQKQRLHSLLDMMYKPSELAEEVGFAMRQVYRVYVPAGCPHERDEKRYLWINGKAFREWALEVYKKRDLASDEAFCLTCKRPVKMIEPVQKRKEGLVYFLCGCPNCGRKLARIVEKKQQGR
jgi:hypothetical protein